MKNRENALLPLVATKVATLPVRAGWRAVLRPAFLRLLALRFERIPDSLACFANGLRIGVRIHPQCDRRIGVPQTLGNGYQITAVSQGNAGACVAELVRVEIVDSISLFQLFEISGW